MARPEGGRGGAAGIEPGSSVPVTCEGSADVEISPGGRVTSDPFPAARGRPREPDGHAATRAWTAGRRAHHPPGLRTTSHLAPHGGRIDALRLPAAVPTPHWSWLAALEVPGTTEGVTVFLGDSLTDGRGSTTDGNDRWPDQLLERLHDGDGLHLNPARYAAVPARLLG